MSFAAVEHPSAMVPLVMSCAGLAFVLAVIRSRNLDRALAIANSTPQWPDRRRWRPRPRRAGARPPGVPLGQPVHHPTCTGAQVGGQPCGSFDMNGPDARAGGPDDLLTVAQAGVTSARFF
jgi:hypothetical protein